MSLKAVAGGKGQVTSDYEISIVNEHLKTDAFLL
jgi:hypothetical protein